MFAAGRNLDQIRTTVCYGNFDVLIAGAHGGVSVGPDGATHQALEDLFQICGLPNMNVGVPCDALETKRVTEHMLFSVKGRSTSASPARRRRWSRRGHAVRLGRAQRLPLPRREAQPHRRVRGHARPRVQERERETSTIVACGPMVPEAMRAAWILKEEFGIETRVINMHTLKPFNPPALVQAALETGIVVTAEEHQIGGLANWVSHALHVAPELYGHPVAFGTIGVKDRFGESGQPWELMWEFEVSGEHIAAKAKELYDFAKEHKPKAVAKPAAKKPAAKKPAAKKPSPQTRRPRRSR